MCGYVRQQLRRRINFWLHSQPMPSHPPPAESPATCCQHPSLTDISLPSMQQLQRARILWLCMILHKRLRNVIPSQSVQAPAALGGQPVKWHSPSTAKAAQPRSNSTTKKIAPILDKPFLTSHCKLSATRVLLPSCAIFRFLIRLPPTGLPDRRPRNPTA